MVKKLVKQGLSGDGKVIIFTEYRDTVDNLMEILNSQPGIKPGRFVGQTTKGSQIGMKQKDQIAFNFLLNCISIIILFFVASKFF